MSKKIIQLGVKFWGSSFVIGQPVYDLINLGNIESIEFLVGSYSDMDSYKESYIVKFENSTKTLEVFDVNYVIRDEE